MEPKFKLINGELVEFTAEEYAAHEELNRPKYDYISLRAAEYPPLSEQLDIIYHQGIDAWKAVIASIKAKYPKPTE